MIETTPIFQRGDPPPAYNGRGHGKWQKYACALAETPGEWVLVLVGSEATVRSPVQSLRRAGCEVTTRYRKNRVSVWARWPEAA